MDVVALGLAKADAKKNYPQQVIVRGAGIDPTGAADSTSAVQSLLNAAGTGAQVFFPAGTYLLNNPIVPLSGQRLYGPGLLQQSSESTVDAIQLTGVTNVIVDLWINGGHAADITANPGAGNEGSGSLVNISGGSTFCKVRGRLERKFGNAVRIYDSSWCTVSDAQISNCVNGAIIGSGGASGDPTGVCDNNTVSNVTMQNIGKNGVLVSGNTNSQAGPNTVRGHKFVGVTVKHFGDTAIELGLGSKDCVVTGFYFDGDGIGYNGLLFRDSSGHAVSGGVIKNIPSYTNGSASYATLGNGIYFWPNFTGQISDITISSVKVQNCTRGVFLQGNNTASDASTDGVNGGAGTISFTDGVTTSGSTTLTSASANFVSGDAGKTITGSGIPSGTTISSVTNATTIVLSQAATATATGVTFGIFGRQVYAGIKLTGIVVASTQLGILDGTWTANQNAIRAHGFYVQSVSGVDLTNCVAHDCQNDGFRVGDTDQQGSWVSDVTLTGCRAYSNGKQAVGGQIYYGFRLNGTTSQANVKLIGCVGSDYQATKTQSYGFSWNSQGSGGLTSAALLIGCHGQSNAVGLFDSIGSVLSQPATSATIISTAGNATALHSTSWVVYTGTGGHTITLQAATTSGMGRIVTVRNAGTGAITVTRNGSATITKTSIAAGETYVYISDGGSNWF